MKMMHLEVWHSHVSANSCHTHTHTQKPLLVYSSKFTQFLMFVCVCVCVRVGVCTCPCACSCMDLCLSMLIKPTDIAVSLLCWFRLKAKCFNILPDLLSPSIYIFPSVPLFSHHPYLSTSVCLSSHMCIWSSVCRSVWVSLCLAANSTVKLIRKSFIADVLFLLKGLLGTGKEKSTCKYFGADNYF